MHLLVDFIDARLPGFRSAVRGATPETIAGLQARTRTPLPRDYVEFLTTMGEYSSVFPAFPGYVWDTTALLDCWPGDDAIAYDKDRYFKVALNASNTGSYDDHFLDLARSDGDDAPLVQFDDPSEDGVPGELNLVTVGAWAETHRTLRAWLCARAFHFFELMRRAELADCGVSTDEFAPEKTFDSVCDVLNRLNLNQPLHARHSWFGVSPDVSVYGDLRDRSVSVCIGAASKAKLLRTVETLRDHLEILDVRGIPRQASPKSL